MGDEAWVAIDFRGARSYARPPRPASDRMLATVLFTDIVEFHRAAGRDGRQRLAGRVGQHNEMTKVELDRYRGRLDEADR